MKIDQTILLKSALLRDIEPQNLDQILGCLNAVAASFRAGEIIWLAGEPADRMGIVLSGRVQIVREEFSGNRSILTELEAGELFGETFACSSDVKNLPVTVLSVTQSAVLTIDFRGIAAGSPSACPGHAKLIENMLGILADKNRLLNRRIGHLSKRTTREKLLSYLSEQAQLQGSRSITIPFDRQELADYLCVERSAMSSALGKLRDEGILSFRKRHFTLNLRQCETEQEPL